MIRCLKSRIEFLFNSSDSFEMPTNYEVMGALANEFGFRMEAYEGQYVFYSKEAREENLLSS